MLIDTDGIHTKTSRQRNKMSNVGFSIIVVYEEALPMPWHII